MKMVKNKPVAWVRYCSDGGIEGPILDNDSRMCETRRSFWTPLYAATAPSASPAAQTVPDIDDLAQFIRSVDGRHDLGAGKLAELICAWMAPLAASPADQVGWQPIETAPMDGTPVLLYARSENARAPVRVVGWWIYGQRWVECAFAPNHPTGLVPTHWMPLLAPPQAMSASKEGA